MQTQPIEKEIIESTTQELSGAAKVGKFLQAKRKEKKLSLDEVCETLKIRKFFLESIELGRLDQLPGSVYTIGFVKAYSGFLGINFEEIAPNLVELTEISQADIPLTTYRLPPPKNLLTRWSIGLSLFLVALSLSYFYFIHEREVIQTPTITTHNEAKEETSKPAESAGISESQQEPQADTQVVDEASLITLLTTKETWIKITDGSNQLVAARLLRPGTYYRIESRPGLLLTAGEADALVIYLGNTKLSRPLPHNAGLLEAFSLEVDSLKAYINTENKEAPPVS